MGNQKSNINCAIHWVNWPVDSVLAFTTTQNSPFSAQSKERNLASTSPYGQFNLGLHVNDNEIEVIERQAKVEKELLQGRKIQWLEQVHGNNVVHVETHHTTHITADAAITKNTAVALAVMTADCLPILLTDKKGKEIAAIHAGWRPLVKNIIAKTVNEMETKPADILCWLGPCIGQQAFEVGVEVKQAFISLDNELSEQFTPTVEGKCFANLQGIAKYLLEKLGVVHISSLDECTYQNRDKYYSYRRDNITGRMASIIAIQPSK
ncbi:peptidoglycan editing factor PgeF [Thalassotalea atypica]|uniref:peptidoglycan editing factor PgeF n=1 Tax=Thalassotalea atypica TaxID=2054316 RepID=UPI002574150F|nr:peptidoglycan editing factor PgeF [Thalassotalea atypica]